MSEKLKRIALIVTFVFTLLCLFYATPLQTIPFVIATILLAFEVYQKKDYTIWLAVLSIIMIFINLFGESLVDMAYWLFIAIISFIKQK